MLASLASAAAAPIRIGNRDMMLSPLSDRDFDELSLWYQGRVLRIARASLDDSSTPAEREETMKAAYAYASQIDFLSEFRGVGLMAEKEVLAQFMWRLLRNGQQKGQKFTLDDARQLVKSGEPLGDAIDAWHLVQFGKSPDASGSVDATEGPGKNDESDPPAPGP